MKRRLMSEFIPKPTKPTPPREELPEPKDPNKQSCQHDPQFTSFSNSTQAMIDEARRIRAKHVEAKLLIGNEAEDDVAFNDGHEEITKYINRTDKDIFIIKPNGMFMVLPPGKERTDEQCVVVKVRNTSKAVSAHMEVIDGSEDKTLDRTRASLSCNNRFYAEDCYVTLEQIEQSRGGVHVRRLSIVIGTNKAVVKQLGYGGSKQAEANEMLRGTGGFDPVTDISITIRLVDSTRTLPTYFLIIGGRGMRLEPVVDSSLDDGLWIAGLTATDGISNGRRANEHYTIEEATNGTAPVRLFERLNDAHVYANKRENEEKEQHLERLAAIQLQTTEKEIERERLAVRRARKEHAAYSVKADNEVHMSDLKLILAELNAAADAGRAASESADRKEQRTYDEWERARADDLALIRHEREMLQNAQKMQYSNNKADLDTTLFYQKGTVETLKTVTIVVGGVVGLWKVFGK